MAGEVLRAEQSSIAERHGVLPKHVVRTRAELCQPCNQVWRTADRCAVRRAGQDADESVLGNRTGRPAVRLMIREPVVCDFVVNVIWIEKGDQNVEVEQRRGRSCQGVSRSSLTSFMVGRGASATLCGKTGTPFRD
jgi:hypothetical protein